MRPSLSHNLSDSDWQNFEDNGYIVLGKLLDDEHVASMQNRIDNIMLGRCDIDYQKLKMQLDSTTGLYKDKGKARYGHQEATLNYRKILGLEIDPLFNEYLTQPLFKNICQRAYGADEDISAMRAMFMNKPAGYGTFLPWHQDRWTDLTPDPLITVWTALDDATIENGCVQVIAKSHHTLVNPQHPDGFLTEDQASKALEKNDRIFLQLKAGESVLLHNWLLHSSDKNHSQSSRRAFSVCYMPTRTKSLSGQKYNNVIKYH